VINYILYSIGGVLFLFIMNTLGASLVFFTKKTISKNTNNITLGFAAGVMMAASIWSLLIPSIDKANNLGIISWLPASLGLLVGFLLLLFINKVYSKISKKKETKRMLFLALTIHNIPEGLAVGLAFGVALRSKDPTLLVTACGLALGIGIQNFPEGASISLPLKEEGMSKKNAFLYSVASGSVEILSGTLGVILASSLNMIMPWLLAFAAGAMIYVIVEELIPSFENNKFHLGPIGFMVGFLLMMILDVALG
jgi:ZIP family zinc transporter